MYVTDTYLHATAKQIWDFAIAILVFLFQNRCKMIESLDDNLLLLDTIEVWC